ncbi:hypothetical protein [Aquimarina rhabdastrellae]
MINIMPELNAGDNVNLGPYERGAKLRFIQPQTDSIAAFPTLNNVSISLTFLPKEITLAQGTRYRLVAGSETITYEVVQ